MKRTQKLYDIGIHTPLAVIQQLATFTDGAITIDQSVGRIYCNVTNEFLTGESECIGHGIVIRDGQTTATSLDRLKEGLTSIVICADDEPCTAIIHVADNQVAFEITIELFASKIFHIDACKYEPHVIG